MKAHDRTLVALGAMFVVLALSLFAWRLRELSSLFTILQYGFLLGFYALVLAAISVSGIQRLPACAMSTSLSVRLG